ncbi:DUF4345 family protein [Pseudohaliea sp.]|uniref:DUF4345 family protein n=1 Tax=Pseudohaliea sp. TaxID=2740289 RepID=UPI0032F03206
MVGTAGEGKAMALARMILRIGFIVLGVSALGIAVSNFLFGVMTTAAAFDQVLRLTGLPASDVGDLAGVNVDNEFRFYSVFWGVYGVLLLLAARRLEEFMRWAGWLIFLFFAGGIGRLFSWINVGEPTVLFVLLTIVEFVLSAVLFAAWVVLRRTQRPPSA